MHGMDICYFGLAPKDADQLKLAQCFVLGTSFVIVFWPLVKLDYCVILENTFVVTQHNKQQIQNNWCRFCRKWVGKIFLCKFAWCVKSSLITLIKSDFFMIVLRTWKMLYAQVWIGPTSLSGFCRVMVLNVLCCSKHVVNGCSSIWKLWRLIQKWLSICVVDNPKNIVAL